MSNHLTTRQKKFIQFYLQTGNGTQAARSAGYTGDDQCLAMQASRLIRNDKVSAALEASAEDSEALKKRLMGEVRGMALSETTEQLSNTQKLRALEMLCKILGLYEEEQRPRMQINLQQINVKEMSEGELLQTLQTIRANDLYASEPTVKVTYNTNIERAQ